jgi:hypothetical protein
MDDNTRLILESNFMILRTLAAQEAAPGVTRRTMWRACDDMADRINTRLRDHDDAAAKFGTQRPKSLDERDANIKGAYDFPKRTDEPASAEFPARSDRISDDAANALLLLQARHVLKNLHVERPGAGYMKLAQACGDAAEALKPSATDGPGGMPS